MNIKLVISGLLAVILLGLNTAVHAQNNMAKSTASCWRVTGWQTPTPANDPINHHPYLTQTPCDIAASNLQWWVQVLNENIWLLMPKNTLYITYYDSGTYENPSPGYYFWPLLVLTSNGNPPVIRTDLIPGENGNGSDFDNKLKVHSGCPEPSGRYCKQVSNRR